MTRPCSAAPLTVGGQRRPDDLVVKVADLSGVGDEGREASVRTDKAVCDRSPAASVTPNASAPVTCRGRAGSIRTQDSLGSRVVTGPGARARCTGSDVPQSSIRSGQPALRPDAEHFEHTGTGPSLLRCRAPPERRPVEPGHTSKPTPLGATALDGGATSAEYRWNCHHARPRETKARDGSSTIGTLASAREGASAISERQRIPRQTMAPTPATVLSHRTRRGHLFSA